MSVLWPNSISFQLICHNNVDFFVPVFATWFVGGRTSVVSPITTSQNIAKQLSTLDVRHVFCGPCSVDGVVKAGDSIKLMATNRPYEVKEVGIFRPTQPKFVAKPALEAGDVGYVLVASDDADKRAGRARFRFYRDRGYEIHHHDLGRTGS